VQISCVYL